MLMGAIACHGVSLRIGSCTSLYHPSFLTHAIRSALPLHPSTFVRSSYHPRNPKSSNLVTPSNITPRPRSENGGTTSVPRRILGDLDRVQSLEAFRCWSDRGGDSCPGIIARAVSLGSDLLNERVREP